MLESTLLRGEALALRPLPLGLVCACVCLCVLARAGAGAGAGRAQTRRQRRATLVNTHNRHPYPDTHTKPRRPQYIGMLVFCTCPQRDFVMYVCVLPNFMCTLVSLTKSFVEIRRSWRPRRVACRGLPVATWGSRHPPFANVLCLHWDVAWLVVQGFGPSALRCSAFGSA